MGERLMKAVDGAARSAHRLARSRREVRLCAGQKVPVDVAPPLAVNVQLPVPQPVYASASVLPWLSV
jgi:hypothetical protein